MVNYQYAKIYKIVDNTNGNIYIGSSCEPILSRRLAQHKSDYKRYLKGNHNFITSFEIIKNGNYEIVLIESYPCNSKDELHSREKFYIENNKCVNKFIPNRTGKKWYEENKEHKQAYDKQKQEKLKQPFICICGSVIRIGDKSHHFKTKKHQRYLEQNKVKLF